MPRLPSIEPGCGCIVVTGDDERTLERLRARVREAIADFFDGKRYVARTPSSAADARFVAGDVVVDERRDGRVQRRGAVLPRTHR